MTQHYRVTVLSKRQMTIPAELCAELGIEQGATLDVSRTEDGAILVRNRRSISEPAGSWSRIPGEPPVPLGRDDFRAINDKAAAERDERSKA